MKVIEGKKKRRKGKIVLYIAIAAFLIYAVVFFIAQQVQIGQKQQELAVLNEKLSTQTQQNDELKAAMESGVTDNSDYIERLARKNLDFAKPGERICVNISGD